MKTKATTERGIAKAAVVGDFRVMRRFEVVADELGAALVLLGVVEVVIVGEGVAEDWVVT